MFGFDMEVVKRHELHTFKVLPKRWIVERNFAWMGWSRRLSKDYELCPTSSETMIWISFTHTLLRKTWFVDRLKEVRVPSMGFPNEAGGKPPTWTCPQI
jgi:hypothetical protein